MREKEFRAYCPETKYMAYQGTPDIETIQSFMFHWGDKILMQYTGFKDRNGKKVYEGDIVKDRLGRIMKIVYLNFMLQFEAISETNFTYAEVYHWQIKYSKTVPDNGYDHTKTEYDQFFNIEVIGNIIENPELLNE